MMKRSMIAASAFATLMLAACSSAERSRNLADPAVPGRVLAEQVCSTCHGVDGNSVSPQFPRLAGQSASYLESQLKHFRSHEREDPPGPEYMWGLSRHLTDEQISDIAAWYARQTPAPGTTGDPGLVGAGRTLYRDGLPDQGVPACQSCHGPDAQGMAIFPRLAGQHADYLLRQMQVFQSTDFRPGTPMTAITHALSEAQMRSVAHFLAAGGPPARSTP